MSIGVDVMWFYVPTESGKSLLAKTTEYKVNSVSTSLILALIVIFAILAVGASYLNLPIASQLMTIVTTLLMGIGGGAAIAENRVLNSRT